MTCSVACLQVCFANTLTLPYVFLQDELADMADLTNEINEAMGQSYAIPDDVDEADLMAELDALEGDLALEDAVGASGPSYLQVRQCCHQYSLIGVIQAVWWVHGMGVGCLGCWRWVS